MKPSDYASREKHLDLIYDHDFMKWCKINYKDHDMVNCRYAYIVHVRGGLTPVAAAEKLKVSTHSIYRLTRKYETAAVKYKAEQNEKSNH